MSRALRALHAEARRAGLDEDARRDLMEREIGKRSAGVMTEAERWHVVKVLKGGRTGAPDAAPNMVGPYAGKLRALWMACHNLALIEDGSDRALHAFVRRQGKVDHPNWLTDAASAKAVIEALKAMLARGGVDWSTQPSRPPEMRTEGYRIAWAQWRALRPDADPQTLVTSFVVRCAALVGLPWTEFEKRHWWTVMNALGRELRARKDKA